MGQLLDGGLLVLGDKSPPGDKPMLPPDKLPLMPSLFSLPGSENKKDKY